MLVKYDNITIGTIKDENITESAKIRIEQNEFFFNKITDLDKSVEWIKAHLNNKEDSLYEICSLITGDFIGVIGAVRVEDSFEMGRLVFDSRAILNLLKSGVKKTELKKIIYRAGMSLSYYLVKSTNAQRIFCQVFENNYFSNKLFENSVFRKEMRSIFVDGKEENIAFYVADKEDIINDCEKKVHILST